MLPASRIAAATTYHDRYHYHHHYLIISLSLSSIIITTNNCVFYLCSSSLLSSSSWPFFSFVLFTAWWWTTINYYHYYHDPRSLAKVFVVISIISNSYIYSGIDGELRWYSLLSLSAGLVLLLTLILLPDMWGQIQHLMVFDEDEYQIS